MNTVFEFIKSNPTFDVCTLLALLIFWYNYVLIRAANKKSDHFISGIPLIGPIIYIIGALTTPCKWLALLVLIEPQVFVLIKSIPGIIAAEKEERKKRHILLMKLEDIKDEVAPLIAELREVRIFVAVCTEGSEVRDTYVVSTIHPSFCFTFSDKEKAYDLLRRCYKIKQEDITVFGVVDESSVRAARVKFMESIYNKVLNGSYKAEDIEVLEKYLATGFKGDFEADEKGLLPTYLKKGVLSEDGLYNLLEEKTQDRKKQK